METIKFRTHLKRLGYGRSTVQMLPSCLQEFLMFTRKNLDEIRSEDILNYKHHLETRANKRKGGSLSESYVHHQLYALQTYFKWQQELGHIIENPISGLSFKTPKSQIRSILSREEIEELYSCCQTLREEAILSLFYGCGLRRSEAQGKSI